MISPVRPASPLPADIRSLTALRFFAAIMVVLFHFASRSEPESVLRGAFFRNGYLGVDLFFVLSGFILAHVYLGLIEAGKFRLGEFLINRLARLYPLHAVMLLLTLSWGLAMWTAQLAPIESYGPQIGLDPATGGGQAAHFASHLLLVHAWGGDGRLYFNGPSWSISAEWFAYLAFPAIAAGCLAMRARPWTGLGLGLALLGAAEIASLVLFGTSLTQRTFDFGIMRIAPEFVLGCLGYLLLRHVHLPATVSRLGLPSVILAVGLGLSGLTSTIVLPVLFTALIVLLADAERSGHLGWQGAPAPLLYLGEISYSIYLTHLFVGRIVFQIMGRILGHDPHALPSAVIGLGVLVVLAAAAVSYHLIEQPARLWIRRSFVARAATSA